VPSAVVICWMAVGPHVATSADRRQVRRELGGYRCHQLGIYTGGAQFSV
jgi:hypothetical protein